MAKKSTHGMYVEQQKATATMGGEQLPTPIGTDDWCLYSNENMEFFQAFKAWCEEHGVTKGFVHFRMKVKLHEFGSTTDDDTIEVE